MAVDPYVLTYSPAQQGSGFDVMLLSFGPMANGDTGQPAQFPAWADCSWQVTGTFGAGGNVAVEGSNDGVNYETLNDPFGVALNFSAAALKQCTEHAQYLRPHVTAGDGTTAVMVTALFRRQPKT